MFIIKTRRNKKYQHQLCVVLIELIQVLIMKNQQWILRCFREIIRARTMANESTIETGIRVPNHRISPTTPWRGGIAAVLRDSVRCGWRKTIRIFCVWAGCWWRSTHDTAKRNGWLWLLAACKMLLPCYRPPPRMLLCAVFLFICVDDQSRISVRPPKMMPKISLLSRSARA